MRRAVQIIETYHNAVAQCADLEIADKVLLNVYGIVGRVLQRNITLKQSIGHGSTDKLVLVKTVGFAGIA
ncbi:hypothetical protein D3C87_1751350 [compost metagenome]